MNVNTSSVGFTLANIEVAVQWVLSRGAELGPTIVERLRARYRHVAWIKEAGGSVDRVDQLKQALGRDLTVLSGDDSLTLPFMSVGAEGVITGFMPCWVWPWWPFRFISPGSGPPSRHKKSIKAIR